MYFKTVFTSDKSQICLIGKTWDNNIKHIRHVTRKLHNITRLYSTSNYIFHGNIHLHKMHAVLDRQEMLFPLTQSIEQMPHCRFVGTSWYEQPILWAPMWNRSCNLHTVPWAFLRTCLYRPHSPAANILEKKMACNF